MAEWYKDSDGYYVNEDYPNIFIKRKEYGYFRSYNTGWFVFSEIDGEKWYVDFKKQKDGSYKAVRGGPKQKFSSLKQVIETVESADLSIVYDLRYIRTKQINNIFIKLCDNYDGGSALELTSLFDNDNVVLELDDLNALEDYVVDVAIDKYNKGELTYAQKDAVEYYLLKKK